MNSTFTKPHILGRIVAGIIDYSIIYGFTFFIVFLLGHPDEEGIYSLNGAPILIPIAFWFIMTVGIECGLGGTLGNSIVGLKAISMNNTNRKLTIGESFKRHLLDVIDMSAIGLVGIIAITNTDKNQRLGDLWAKTVVVKMSSIND